MKDPILAYTCGGGIGDALFLASTVEALRTIDPSREHAMALNSWKKSAWWRIVVDQAPFRTFEKPPRNGWKICRSTPWRLRCDEHVVVAHLRALAGKAAQAHGIRIDVDPSKVSRAPAWFGPRPPIEPSHVGVFVGERLRAKEWPGSEELIVRLRRRRIRAERSPVHENPMVVVEWIARCRVFVGPDTGLTHVAAALDVPTVILLGGRFTAANFDYPNATHVVCSDCGRAPCMEWTRRARPHPCLWSKPADAQIPCIAAIQPERVEAIVVGMLDRGMA